MSDAYIQRKRLFVEVKAIAMTHKTVMLRSKIAKQSGMLRIDEKQPRLASKKRSDILLL